MNIERLRYFAEVARQGNLTEAASKCFITQSAMSQQMSMLERELGIRLLKRTGKGTVLTDAGAAMLPKVQRLLECYDEILEAAAAVQEQEERLRILYSGPVEEELLLKAIPVFREKYPSVQTELQCVPMASYNDLLRRNECDLILTIPGEIVMEGVMHETITQRRVCIAVSDNSPLADRESLSLPDLAGQQMVLLRDEASNGGNRLLVSWLIENGFDAKAIRYTNSINDQLMLVRLNQGVTIFPAGRFYAGITQIPFLKDEPLYLCTEAVAIHPTPACKALIDLLRAVDREV